MTLLCILFTYIGYGVQYIMHWPHRWASISFCLTVPLAMFSACVALFVLYGDTLENVIVSMFFATVGMLLYNYIHKDV